MISVDDRSLGAGSGTVAGVLGLLITLLGFAGVMVLAQPRPEKAAALEPAAAVTIAPLAVPAAPPPAPPAPALPRGKGMWLHYLRQAAGNDPVQLVAKARDIGLSHVYLRLGSSKDGFYG